MARYPRCAAHLRDGQPCLRTVVDGSEFCVHDAELAEANGPEALKRDAQATHEQERVYTAARDRRRVRL